MLSDEMSQHLIPSYNGLGLDFKDLYNAIVRGEDTSVLELVKCMVLCNNVNSPNEKLSDSEDQILLTLAKQLGCYYEYQSPHIVTLFLNQLVTYTIEAYQEPNVESKRTRIIVREAGQDCAVLYVKGEPHTMMRVLNSSPKKLSALRRLIKNTLTGMKHLILGYKVLEPQEFKEFSTAYDMARMSPINKDARVEALISEYENNLNYLGIIGIEHHISSKTKDCISRLKRAGLKFWMLTGDSESSSVSAAIGSGIVKNDYNLLTINDIQTEQECLQRLEELIFNVINQNWSQNSSVEENSPEMEEGKEGFTTFEQRDPVKFDFTFFNKENRKKSLGQVGIEELKKEPEGHKKQFRSIVTNAVRHLKSTFGQLRTRKIEFNKPLKLASEYNLSLAIEGLSLEFALRSVHSRKLFVILLNLADSVVFYNLLPYQKRQIITLVKNNFTKKAQVLAVGGDLEDIPMLQEADVSLSMIKHDEIHSLSAPDVTIPIFSRLNYVILCLGHWTFLNVARVTGFVFYNSFMLGTITFLYVFYNNFSVSTVMPSHYQFLLEHVLLLIPLISVGTWDRDRGHIELIQNEGLYKEGKYDLSKYPYFLGEFCVLGAVHGLVIFYLILGGTSGFLSSTAITEDRYILSNFILLASYTTGAVTLYLQIFNRSVKTISGFLLSLIVLLVFAVVTSSRDLLYGKSLYYLLTEIGTYLIIGLPVCCNTLITMFYLTSNDSLKCLANKTRVNTVTFINRIIETDINKFFKDSKDWGHAEEKFNFEMNKYTQKFNSSDRENNYFDSTLYKIHSFYSDLYVLVLVYISLVYIWTVVFLLDWTECAASASALLTPLLIYSFLAKATRLLPIYKQLTISYFLFLHILLVVLFFNIGKYTSLISPPLILLLLLGFSIDWVLSLLTTSGISLIILLGSSLVFSEFTVFIEYTSHLIGFLFVCSTISYKLEHSQRTEFIIRKKLEIEAQKVHSVLSCLLPPFVRKNIKDTIKYYAEDKGTVTVIFCDICHFIDIVEYFNPQELTTFLDETFRKFDHLCESVGVTKIETVGYTYMACVGLKDSDAEVSKEYRSISHARRAIEFGLLILGAIKNIYVKPGKTLEVKIGIHSGPVAAGVVGSHKPQFALVGDTVNTASRMASTLPVFNSIQFTKCTWQLVKEREGLVYSRHSVDVKGKGKMKVYRMSLEAMRGGIYASQLPSPLNNHMNSLITKVWGNTPLVEPAPPAMRRSTIYALFDVNNTREFLKNKGLKKLVRNLTLLSFRFKYSKNDQMFRVTNLSNVFLIFSVGVGVKICLVLLKCMTESAKLVLELDAKSWESLMVNSSFLLAYSLMVLSMKSLYKSTLYAWALQLLVLTDTLVSVLLFVFSESYELEHVLFLFVYNLLLLTHCSMLLFNEALYLCIITSLFWLLTLLKLDLMDFLISLIILTFTVIPMVTFLYRREEKLRFMCNFEHAGNNEITETEKLLVKMFPPQIYDELKNDTIDINKFYSATLLYADIVGFTAWSADQKPRDVVEQLSELFAKFDSDCQKYNVYKVHTIGDCYVVMGYDPSKGARDPGHEAINMINFAHSMIRVIQEVNEECGLSLNMRIGIHTGDIIGGITGSNIVRYDIYGIDVLIANKIESNGIPGEIAVSNYTKILLERFRRTRFSFESITEFTVHKNKVEVYKLTDKFKK